jgi:UPF0755 protein
VTNAPSRPASYIGLTILLLALVAFLGPLLALVGYMVPGPLTENKTVIIPHGTSTHEIATALSASGVIRNPLIFRMAAKLTQANSLKAGEYEFTPRQSIADVMLMMHEGHSVVHMFTVAEGLTSAEVINALRNNPSLTGDVAMPAEGSLLPESYRYSYGDSRSMMISRMQKGLQDALNDLWPNRDPAIPLQTPEQAVVMASIIEKETGKVAERPRIAGVFYNRLRTNMKLQSDPTVIYAITLANGPLNRELAHDDLAFVSPYNTYTIDGLPPQPICNPGRAALDAALHPEQNEFLYFVADGTGGHVFSKDLATHNQNVTKWNAVKPKAP